jgi:hypothetical protein
MQASKIQKAQNVKDSDFRSTGRRREVLERRMARVRMVEGEAWRVLI